MNYKKFLIKQSVTQEKVHITVTPLSIQGFIKGKTVGKNLIYIRLNNHKVKKTKEITDKIYIDYDYRGNIVGIEII